MREEILSTTEKEFILNSFCEGQRRIDWRKRDEFREVKVIVGSELGTCLAILGKTKVFGKISCDLVEPRSARGNIGTVDVQVDMSPMGSPTYEDGKLGPKGIELTRILEMLLRDCGVIDLESLCIRSYKQVWQIRVDLHVLDTDGGLIDCCSIAAVTALSHFRRPDVSVLPDSVIVHSVDEKVPIPLNIYHMPICVSFGIMPDLERIVVDPTEKEELCLKGVLLVAGNKRHEICALDQIGTFIINQDLIARCVDMAIQRAVDVTELITAVIADDNLKRSKREPVPGFANLVSLDMLTSHRCEPNELIAPAVESSSIEMNVNNEEENFAIADEGEVRIGGEPNRSISSKDREQNELIKQVKEIAASQTASHITLSERATASARAEMDELNELLDGIEEDLAVLLPLKTGSANPSLETPSGKE